MDYRHTFIIERSEYTSARLTKSPEGARGVARCGNVAANLRAQRAKMGLDRLASTQEEQ